MQELVAKPERTGFWVRSVASLLDWIVTLGLATLLTSTTGTYFARRAVVMLHVGQPGSPWKGLIPMLLGAVSTVAYGVPFALLGVLLMEAFFGTSPGKLLFRREIVSSSVSRNRALWVRFAVKTSGAWLFCLGLVSGWWPLAVVAVAATAAVLSSALPLAVGRRTLHDRIAGTVVIPRARAAIVAPRHAPGDE